MHKARQRLGRRASLWFGRCYWSFRVPRLVAAEGAVKETPVNRLALRYILCPIDFSGASEVLAPVASVVVARSQCPVLTVPTHPFNGALKDAGLFSRIVCAVDLTPSSASVIRQVLSIGWETKGHLTYVCVAGNDTATAPAAVRDVLLEAIPPEASSWCTTDVIVSTGAAGSEIVRIAAHLNADVVVIGAPRRWISTTHAVLSRSLCPVLVPHDARPLPWPVVYKPAAPAAQHRY